MTPKNQTSRTNILDMIDLATNLIAGSSHIQEKLKELRKEVSMVDSPEAEKQIGILEDIDRTLTIKRRDLMSEMLRQANQNQDENHYWCLAKHIFACYGLSLELVQSDYENTFFREMYDDIFDLVLKTLYLFLGLEDVPTCSRCLADKMSNKLIEQNERTL